MNSLDPTLSRRRFLGSLGSASLSSSLLQLNLAGKAAGAGTVGQNDFKALVCLFMNGGNDSFNMLAPMGSDYQDYSDARGNLGLSEGDLLPLNTAPSDSRSYGVHPNLPEIRSLFNNNELSFVANVGTLIERPDESIINNGQLIETIRNGGLALPVGTYSHSDQQMSWQSARPDRRSSIGWGGRTADILQALNTDSGIGMGISIDGSNVFQSGNNSVHYTLDNNGSPALKDYDRDDTFANAVNRMLNRDYDNIFQRNYAKITKSAIEAQQLYSSATENLTELQTIFPNTDLGGQLRRAVLTIAAREGLGMRRQTFFVSRGGFDNHSALLEDHAELMTELDDAVSAFWAAIKELGLENEVTLFSASDFGRTLAPNSNLGSDHGWGGNQFILGGSQLNGGDILGTYPSLTLGNNLDTGQGRFLPTTAIEEYFSELICWLGVETEDLATVLPNIGNFFDPMSTPRPLGVMV